TDIIRFGVGINPTDITLNRDANNLYITLNGTTDKITVLNWFYSTASRVEKIEFANGTSWDVNKLASTVYIGTANADTLSGSNQNETFYGLAGNDTIYGGNGNDIIEGGVGNDALYGGNSYYSDLYSSQSNGNDIYLFNTGFGQDTIVDYDTTSGNTDIIRFGVGINPTDITLNRDANNLYITLNGTTDKITVLNWFYSTAS
ncbi:MAG: calcium-binding protein, partial [Dolichospermum sp.]